MNYLKVYFKINTTRIKILIYHLSSIRGNRLLHIQYQSNKWFLRDNNKILNLGMFVGQPLYE